MKLEVGQSKSFRLPFWLKAVDVSCEEKAVRLERRGKLLQLVASEGGKRNHCCIIPLGYAGDLKGVEYEVKVQSKTRMLFSLKNIRFVIDFGAKRAATNLIGLRIYGSERWGEYIQSPWRAEYQSLFGLPVPPMELDRQAAEYFWKWFHARESEIVPMVNGNKRESKAVFRSVELWLYPVFPYVKNGKISFDLECQEQGHTFTFHTGGDEQLAADATAFGELMPEGLRRQWKFVVTQD